MGHLTERLHSVIDDLMLNLSEYFTERERQSINASRTNIEKVKEFFISIKTKSVDAYEKCLTTMENLKGYHDLAETLRKEWKIASQQSTVHAMKSKMTLIASYV